MRKQKKIIPTCAVCGKVISMGGICSACYRKWGNSGNYPEWLRELVRMHRHFSEHFPATEITFTEDGRDMSGEKLVDEDKCLY